MLRASLAILLTSATLQSIAQQPCGTAITPRHLAELQPFVEWMGQQPLAKAPDTNTYHLPLKFHVVRHSDGTGGVDTALLPVVLDTLNYFFRNANIRFAPCGKVNFVDNDQFTAMEAATEEKALTANRSLPRAVNMYIMDSVLIDGNLACGYSYLPGGPVESFITKSCLIEGNTPAHELGHIFSLIHTHGPSNSQLTDELVDGSNCKTAGDQVCDTPADPNLNGKMALIGCAYTGNEVDANGDAFQPMLDNIMSYAKFECNLDSFTPLQYKRMYWSLFFHKRIDLVCTSEEDNITATAITGVYPNPFFTEITISFELAQKSVISLALYDVLGHRLRELAFDEYEAGKARLYVPLGDTHLAQGVYVVRMEINGGAAFSQYKIFRLN